MFTSSTAALDGVITQKASNAYTTHITPCGGLKDLGLGRCLHTQRRLEVYHDLVGLELARLATAHYIW